MNKNAIIYGTIVLTAGFFACGGGSGDGDGGTGGGGGGGGPGAAAARFFLPTGAEARNTVNPTIETDAQGDLHMVYPAYAIGDAFYAFCNSACKSQSDVKTVKLETTGTVANAMLALAPDGKPHVLLSTYQRVYYAACAGDCTQRSGWTLDVIVEHDAEREVTGEAFAFTPGGKPRFVMHTYRAFLGIGQKPPATWYMTCDSDCGDAASWSEHQIATQIWQESTLRFTADGSPRLATVATVEDESGKRDIGAYVECNGACTDGDDWIGAGLFPAYSNRTVELIDPAISMALTSAGAPRIAILGLNDQGKRNMVYFECDADCASGAGFRGTGLIESEALGAGLDIVVDAQDRPRLVYTASSSILLARCDERCTDPEGPWKLTKVELGSDMKPDEVIPYPNCTVAAWFLRHPSLALGQGGMPRVVYRAEDISGGGSRPDPTRPPCRAGADMTFARFAQLAAME